MAEGAVRVVALALLLFLAACGQEAPRFHNADVTGAEYGKDFALTDHHGRPRSLADYRGKVVALYFGYTQCPDFCPTTLSAMKQVMNRLGPEADKLQVMFVTVDPERDTQALLAEYVPAFDPRFVGLYGDGEAVARAAKEYRIFYRKAPGQTPATYTVDHSTQTYLIDPRGRLRLVVKHGEDPAKVAEDVVKLLQGA